MSVGGDGTFLDAARHLLDRPILGVNSDPEHSVGRFCSANPKIFKAVLDHVIHNKLRIQTVYRMQIRIDGRLYPTPILNDVLICHACPAAMSHYVLKLKGTQERQRSSGIWISTAAGSTGVVKSLGGKVLGLGSDKLQYRPRELYEGRERHYRLTGGVFAAKDGLKVLSQTPQGMIYVDGAHRKLKFSEGVWLSVEARQPVLKVL